MKNLYANLALSRALQGLNLGGDMWWVNDKEPGYHNMGEVGWKLSEPKYFSKDIEHIPAPSIFSLITTHARTVFGEEKNEEVCMLCGDDYKTHCICDDDYYNGTLDIPRYKYHTQKILSMLQDEATVDEVSEYILLNKK